jgi:hypothetical protein
MIGPPAIALPTFVVASSSPSDAPSNIRSNSCTHALGSSDSESLEFSDFVLLELSDSESSAADIAGACCNFVRILRTSVLLKKALVESTNVTMTLLDIPC